jgi:hypothetical protein
VSQQPQVSEVLLRTLGMLVRRIIAQAGDLVFLDLHGRVAKLLLRLIEDPAAHASLAPVAGPRNDSRTSPQWSGDPARALTRSCTSSSAEAICGSRATR